MKDFPHTLPYFLIAVGAALSFMGDYAFAYCCLVIAVLQLLFEQKR